MSGLMKRVGSEAHALQAKYCYGVWLSHLKNSYQPSGWDEIPKSVAEVGPGEALGVGLAALISGVERYRTFDVVQLVEPGNHLPLVDQLVELFRNREPSPQPFPSNILTDRHLEGAMEPGRIAAIREAAAAIDDGKYGGEMLSYTVPWVTGGLGRDGEYDLVLSQAALMYEPNLEMIYAEISRVLRTGGCTSNQIDFSCAGATKDWDGHRLVSDSIWGLLTARRPYYVSRRSPAEHIRAMEEAGLKVLAVERTKRAPSCDRNALSPRFRDLSAEDRETSSALFAAVKN